MQTEEEEGTVGAFQGQTQKTKVIAMQRDGKSVQEQATPIIDVTVLSQHLCVHIYIYM